MTFKTWLREQQAAAERDAMSMPKMGPRVGSSGVKQTLRRSMRHHEIYFRIAFGLAVLLALVTLIAAMSGGAEHNKWVPATFGISAFGAVAFAIKCAREKLAFELMVELAAGLDDAAMRSVLDVLIRQVSKGEVPKRASAQQKASASELDDI